MAKSIELAIRIAGKVDKSLNNSFRAAQNQMGTLQKVANLTSIGVAAGAAAIGSAALAAGKQLLDLGGEWQEAANQMASATGAAGDELQDLRDIMEDIYANNFGENVEDVADALAQVKTNMADLPTEQLQTATEAAIALRDALDYDVASTTRAAEAMRKNFGTAAKDAFSLIAAGAQNGLDYSGELLDTISEYSVQFSKLGFDADGMFQVLQSGADSTAWNLDKVGDAIKEFSVRAIDGSDTTIDAYEALGYNAEETMAIFAKGGDVANAAFFNVLDSLLAVKDQVERDALGVALFGTMWEDLGVEAMTALSQASDAAYDTKDALSQINSVKYNDLDNVLEGLGRKLEVALLPAADAMYQALLDQSPQLEAAISEVAPMLAELASDFTTDAAGFLAENLPAIIQFVREAAAAAGDLYRQLQPVLAFLWEHKEAVLAVVVALRLLGPTLNVVSTAMSLFKSAKTFLALLQASGKISALTGALKTFGSVLTGPVGIVLALASALVLLYKNWDTVRAWLEDFGSKVETIWAKVSSIIEGGIAAIGSKFPALGAYLNSWWQSIQSVYNNVRAIFQNLINFIGNVFSGNWSAAWQNIVNIFKNVFGAIGTLITAPLSASISAVQQMWTTITGVISNGIAAIGSQFPILGAYLTGWWQSIQAAAENVLNIFSGIIDFIGNVFSGNWSAAWQNIVDIFSNIFGMIANLVKAPINGVISVINYAIEKINGISVTVPDWVPGIGGGTFGFNIPTIPQLAAGGIATRATLAEIGEGGEPEAVMPLSKLAQLLNQVTGLDLNGGGNPGGGDPQVIQFAPVFNFYGSVSKEQAEEAGRLSFAEFMKLYKRMQAEEKRKKFAPA